MVDLNDFTEHPLDSPSWNVPKGKRIVLLRLPKDMHPSELSGLKIKYPPRATSATTAVLADFSRQSSSVEVSEHLVINRTCASGTSVPLSLAIPLEMGWKLSRGFDEMWTVNRKVDGLGAAVADTTRTKTIDEVELEEQAKHLYKTPQPPVIASAYRPLSCANVKRQRIK